jgi:type I restriction enzyme M protein
METEIIMTRTKAMIDDLKTVCANYGLGNASSEYKIITEVFLYKFLNDKFLYEARQADDSLKNSTNIEADLVAMDDESYDFLLASLPPTTAQLKKEHFISYLFNRKNTDKFNELFDDTLIDIANFNIDVFSVKTGSEDKIRLFDAISVFVTETNKRSDFCRAIIDKLVAFSFAEAFAQKYDFFAAVFEYLIKDYNKDFGKYAEYYTPHSIASIIAKIMVPDGAQNVTVYDPAAGSGTLVLALAHEIGEENCTIYTQDISQKSNEFLRLNLILNNLVHSLGNVVHGDTLLQPEHLNKQKNGLMRFDFIVSNPPFNMDFSDNRDTLAGEKYKERFWAGVPNIPKKDKKSMAIYLMFLQHILFSMGDKARAAIVVPSGFLTDTGSIQTAIRDYIIDNHYLFAAMQMPTNVFANTNTSVSVLFVDKSRDNNKVMFVDASKMGKSIKVDDNARTVLSADDEKRIIEAILKRESIPEFSVEVDISEITANEKMIKPGLYFEMQYPLLHDYSLSMDDEIMKLRQKQAGLLRVTRSAYARNLLIKWFVDFDLPIKYDAMYESDYGMIPDVLDLIPLEDLIDETLGGEWGKEESEGRYTKAIRCIRGTDIPNVQKSYYEDIPVRYVQKKHIDEKGVKANDIIVEISGGSPIQSTGRICYISDEILQDINAPVLCTNFCRIIRLKNPELAEYVYNYLLLLYSRGYFFNLENNTTGIKNLIFSAFAKNIKVPLPKDLSLIQEYYAALDEYCSGL